VTQRGLAAIGLVLVTLFAGAPSRAASASDYARLTAPDVPSAAAFLRDNLDCRVLDVRSSHALLECGTGSVVEIARGRPDPGNAPALRLRTEDADAIQG